MKKFQTLILDKKTIQTLIDMKKAIPAVEAAFREYGLGHAQMPPKIYLELEKFDGDFRAMPVYLSRLNKCSLKWVNAHPGNAKYNLPAVMAVIILSDPQTGFPLSIMDGTYATTLRTGAASGVAAKYLARKDSSRVALIGCGIQGHSQLAALRQIFKIREVNVWGKSEGEVKRFIKEMRRPREIMSASATIASCVQEADIIVTSTPSRAPIVRREWIKKGTHINAIGADAAGKQELDPKILRDAKVVVDDWAQAAHSGEINVPVSLGLLSRADIYAQLGEIVAGKKSGRISQEEVTVFDSTGLAIQDVAVADLIYKTACRRKVGKVVDLLGVGGK